MLSLLAAGCTEIKLPSFTDDDEQPALVKVKIVFRDGEALDGYVRGLAMGEDSKIYIGGATATPVYDAAGNVTGVVNYNQVLYMKVVH